MSETSAGGSGGAVTPGWYTDPHDPRQLRWWSGEGWTEHVSAATAAPQAAAQTVAAEVAPAEVAPQQAVPAQQAVDPLAPLPSRRALRDPATEASEAAEAALAGQAAQQQAEQQAAAQAQADQQAQAAAAAQQAAAEQAAAQQAAAAQVPAEQVPAEPVSYQSPHPGQPVQPDQQAEYPAPVAAAADPVFADPVSAAPVSAVPLTATPVDVAPFDAQPLDTPTPSAPVPTLPVAPTSFLEQQGYTPMDGAPADPNAWGQPAQETQTPPPVEPAAPNAWNQPVQPTQAADPVQPNAWNQPVDPAQALQPIQPIQPVQPPEPAQPLEPLQVVDPAQAAPPVQPPQPNAWNQPLQPAEQAQPVQQGWGTPAAPVAQATPAGGMDSLFAGAASDQVATQDAQANQWGLAPTEGDTRAGRRGTEAAQVAQVAQVAGSSSFWAWLIAISPILAAGSIAYVLLTTKSALTSWPFEAAVAVPYLLVLLFAIGDRAVLLQLGHTSPRSPAWAFATAPIYLIQRAAETRREDGSGTLLTIVWFASFIVAIAGIVGYGLLTHHALISGLPT